MSGIPDLLVWRIKDSIIKFVEVKGPGDGLSENQKVGNFPSFTACFS